MMDIKQQSMTAFKWEIVGKILNPLIFLASTVFLSRILEPEHFGQLAIIQVVTLILISLLDFGFGVVLIQKRDIDESHFSSVFWLCLVSSFVVSLLLFIFSGNISLLLFNNLELEPFLKAIPICIIISVYINNQIFRLKKEMNFSVINISLVLSAFLSGCLAVLLAFKGFKTWSLVSQLILNYVFQSIILFIGTKWRIKLIFSTKAIRHLWGMGRMMFLGNGLDIIYFHLDSIIIGKIFPPKTLGYYNRSKLLDSMVVNFTSGTLSFLLPAFSLLQDSKEKLKNAFIYVLHALSAMVFLIIGILYICAKDVIIIIFGYKWINSIDFFKILILGSYAYPISTLLVHFIISTGKSKMFIVNEIIKKFLLTIAFVIGFQYGIAGYLYSFIVLAFFGTSLNAYYAGKSIDISLFGFYKHVYKYFLIAVFLVCAFKLIDNYLILNEWSHLILVGFFYSIFYIALMHIFKLYGFTIIKTEIINLIKKGRYDR